MTNQLLSKGNITTLATWIAIGITALIGYFGIKLDLTPFIPAIAGLITLVIAVYSSKHPNTFAFFGNDQDEVSISFDAEDLEQTIQELMDKYNANSTIDVEPEEESDELDEADDDDG